MSSGPTFADLIKAREAQQAMIRSALLSQNAKLKEKLRRARSQSPNGEAGLASDEDDDFDQQISEMLHAMPPLNQGSKAEGPGAESGTPAGTDNSPAGRRSNTKYVPMERFVELHDTVTQIQASLTDIHRQQTEMIEAVRDELNKRFSAVESKVSDLQAAMAVEERTQALLREEQTEQHLTLCREIDSIRAAETAIERRLDSRDATVVSLEEATRRVSATADSFEERIVSLEGFPAALRTEIAELDQRFAAMNASVRSERASVMQLNTDLNEQRAAEFQSLMKEAAEELSTIRTHAKEAIENVVHVQQRVRDLVHTGIEEVATRLESELGERLQSQDARILGSQQRQAVEHNSMSQSMNQSLTEIRSTVDSALSSLRASYDEAVQSQLKAIVDAADEHERQRREEFPVVDADRVALMLQELQGAQTMIEGIARNTMALGHKCPLTNRVKELETKLDELVATKGLGLGNGQEAKICFTVPVQTEGILDRDSNSRDPALIAQRRFQEEMNRAVTSNEDAKLWRAISEATGGSSPTNSRDPSANPLPPAQPSHRPSTSTHASGVAAIGSPEELRQTIRMKEAQLQKIQQVLRTIQEKFHDLTQKESRSVSASSGSKPLGPEAKRVADLIIKQKEAVYQHERQLLDQRNRLLHEIRELTSKEEQMASSR